MILPLNYRLFRNLGHPLPSDHFLDFCRPLLNLGHPLPSDHLLELYHFFFGFGRPLPNDPPP